MPLRLPAWTGTTYTAMKWMGYSEELTESMLEMGERDEPSAKRVHLRTVTEALHADDVYRSGCLSFMFFALYFTLVVLILSLQSDTRSFYVVNRAVVGALTTHKWHDRSPAVSIKDSIISVDGIYDYLSNVWAATLFEELKGVNNTKQGVTDTTEVFYGQNKLLASPRVRQGRLKYRDCDIGFYKGNRCLGGWDDQPFATSDGKEQKPDTRTNTGVYSIDFVFNAKAKRTENSVMVSSLQDVQKALQSMQEHHWISAQTAWVACDAWIYNIYYESLTTVFVVFEITAAGEVVPMASYYQEYGSHHKGSAIATRRIRYYSHPVDFVRLVLELVFVILTLLLTYGEFQDMWQARQEQGTIFAYFEGGNLVVNSFDLASLVISYFCIIQFIIMVASAPTLQEGHVILEESPTAATTRTSDVYYVATAFYLIVQTFRLFRYLHFHHKMAFVAHTLKKAGGKLVYFGAMFLLVVVGYSICAFYFFGPGLGQYYSPFEAFVSTIKAALGDINYDNLTQPHVDPSYGVFPFVFFWSYILVVYFALINMFLAIIVGAYDAIIRSLSKVAPRSPRGWIAIFTQPYQAVVLMAVIVNGWVVRVQKISVDYSHRVYTRQQNVFVNLSFLPFYQEKLTKLKSIWIVHPKIPNHAVSTSLPDSAKLQVYINEDMSTLVTLAHIRTCGSMYSEFSIPENLHLFGVHREVLSNTIATESTGNRKTELIKVTFVFHSGTPANQILDITAKSKVKCYFSHSDNLVLELNKVGRFSATPYIMVKQDVPVEEFRRAITIYLTAWKKTHKIGFCRFDDHLVMNDVERWYCADELPAEQKLKADEED